ncbi:hypothetical protein D3C78_1933240 [compost metagenome]
MPASRQNASAETIDSDRNWRAVIRNDMPVRRSCSSTAARSDFGVIQTRWWSKKRTTGQTARSDGGNGSR